MKENLSTRAGERAEIYHLLAGLFLRPPTQELLSLAAEGDPSRFLPMSDRESPWKKELAVFAEEAAAMGDLVNEMEAEHTALFVLPSGVIPQEAMYLDGKKRLGGSVTIAVGRFYEQAVIEVDDGCIEMPDHLGMELEFLSRLCNLEKLFRKEGEIESLAACLTLQRDFMTRHIGRWVHLCCEDVTKMTSNGFYRAVALFTSEFLRIEEEEINELFVRIREEDELCENMPA